SSAAAVFRITSPMVSPFRLRPDASRRDGRQIPSSRGSDQILFSRRGAEALRGSAIALCVSAPLRETSSSALVAAARRDASTGGLDAALSRSLDWRFERLR